MLIISTVMWTLVVQMMLLLYMAILPVQSQVTIVPGQTSGGREVRLLFQVPQSCIVRNQEFETTEISVEIPDAVLNVKVEQIPGLQIDLTNLNFPENEPGNVIMQRGRRVIWTSDIMSIASARELGIIVQLPQTSGQLFFPTKQSCSNGVVNMWNQIPSLTNNMPEFPAPSVHVSTDDEHEIDGTEQQSEMSDNNGDTQENAENDGQGTEESEDNGEEQENSENSGEELEGSENTEEEQEGSVDSTEEQEISGDSGEEQNFEDSGEGQADSENNGEEQEGSEDNGVEQEGGEVQDGSENSGAQQEEPEGNQDNQDGSEDSGNNQENNDEEQEDSANSDEEPEVLETVGNEQEESENDGDEQETFQSLEDEQQFSADEEDQQDEAVDSRDESETFDDIDNEDNSQTTEIIVNGSGLQNTENGPGMEAANVVDSLSESELEVAGNNGTEENDEDMGIENEPEDAENL